MIEGGERVEAGRGDGDMRTHHWKSSRARQMGTGPANFRGQQDAVACSLACRARLSCLNSPTQGRKQANRAS